MKFTNMVTGEQVAPTDWQLALKAGDHYAIDTEWETIYGVIQKQYGRRSQGTFLVKAYTRYCSDGEVGMLHICDPTRPLTQEEFTAAKARNWQ